MNNLATAKMDRYIEEAPWTEGRVSEVENRLLQGIFACRTTEAVESAITYARFLSNVGITPENYPVFLRMLEIENHWVVDELIGKRDPFLLLSGVQPNRFIVGRVMAMMTRWHRGGIYHKNLSVILGVLQSVYSSPTDGFRIYPLSIADTNALGKHLDKEKGQDEPLNRAILEVLDKISDLEDAGNPEMEEIALHATAIRNAFFDDRKSLDTVVPPVLMVMVADRIEVPPRRTMPVRKGAPNPRAGGDDKAPTPAIDAEEAKTASRPLSAAKVRLNKKK